MPKPIDRHQQLLALSARLGQAGGEQDWLALARIDRELAGQLAAWQGGAAWTAAERQALDGLRLQHGQASALVHAELARLGQLLQQLTENRGRWTAYAESADWEETQS